MLLGSGTAANELVDAATPANSKEGTLLMASTVVKGVDVSTTM